MKKKILGLILVVAILVMNLAGCGQPSSANEGEKTLQIVCTTFPLYDWVSNLLGDQQDNIELTLLMDNGVDLHSYQASAKDMIKLKTSDLVVYVGGPSEAWLDKGVQETNNKDQQIIRLFDVLAGRIKEEEMVEGMQEDEHSHAHTGEDDHEETHLDEDIHDHKEDEHTDAAHEDEIEYDEHVWLSLRNAQIACGAIADALVVLDAQNEGRYKANLESYMAQLKQLDAEYEEMIGGAKRQTLLVGDRFPFRYLVEDYDLDYYAAFAGCSAETEASFETVTFLADKMNTLELPAILVLENSDQALANTVIESTQEKSQRILHLDSMQSVTSKDIEAGTSYLQIMAHNLEVLKEALN